MESISRWSRFTRLAFLAGLVGVVVGILSRDSRGTVLMAFVTVSIVPENVLSRTEVLIKYLAVGVLAILVWYVSLGRLRWAFLILGAALIGYSIRNFVQKF